MIAIPGFTPATRPTMWVPGVGCAPFTPVPQSPSMHVFFERRNPDCCTAHAGLPDVLTMLCALFKGYIWGGVETGLLLTALEP